MNTSLNIRDEFLKLSLSEKILVLEELRIILESEQGMTEINFEVVEQIAKPIDVAAIELHTNIEVTPQQTKKGEHNQNVCPHCGCHKIIRWGTFQGRIRYKCSECNRTYTEMTGTAIHAIKKKDKFKQYQEQMFTSNYPTVAHLRESIGVSQHTSFEWRHKILCSLAGQSDKFSGITEVDEQWFLYSQKGRKGLKYARRRGGSKRKGDNNFQSKLLITASRNGGLDMSLVRIGRLQANDIRRKLKGRMASDMVLVSDSHPSIKSFAKRQNIEHKSFISKEHVKDKQYHVQLVNNVASRFKSVINYQLRGVSTKYLQNYANWFKIKEQYKKSKETLIDVAKEISKSASAWDLHTNIEKIYETFLTSYSVRTYRCPTKRYRKSQNWNWIKASETDWL